MKNTLQAGTLVMGLVLGAGRGALAAPRPVNDLPGSTWYYHSTGQGRGYGLWLCLTARHGQIGGFWMARRRGAGGKTAVGFDTLAGEQGVAALHLYLDMGSGEPQAFLVGLPGGTRVGGAWLWVADVNAPDGTTLSFDRTAEPAFAHTMIVKVRRDLRASAPRVTVPRRAAPTPPGGFDPGE